MLSERHFPRLWEDTLKKDPNNGCGPSFDELGYHMQKPKHQFCRVLIVDDCEITQLRLGSALNTAGYDTVSCGNGAIAINEIKRSTPDYIITDWHMPNLNGPNLCRYLRNQELPNYIYMIMMSADLVGVDVIRGLGAGADDYVAKPVPVPELLAKMEAGKRILELDRRLTYAADHDPLTGVLNRRSLLQTMNEIVATESRPVCSVMVDVDNFKSINDQHGHLVGDFVLVQVADALQEVFKTSDCIYRYGGEEFAIILPDCDEATALELAERGRSTIEQAVMIQGDYGEVTASFGVAPWVPDCPAVQFLQRADSALYEAKQAGRNRVVTHSDLLAREAAGRVSRATLECASV